MNRPAIPTYWSAEEALTFVAFLEEIIADIWRARGDEMAACLHRARHPPDRPPSDPSPTAAGDDIPF